MRSLKLHATLLFGLVAVGALVGWFADSLDLGQSVAPHVARMRHGLGVVACGAAAFGLLAGR